MNERALFFFKLNILLSILLLIILNLSYCNPLVKTIWSKGIVVEKSKTYYDVKVKETADSVITVQIVNTVIYNNVDVGDAILIQYDYNRFTGVKSNVTENQEAKFNTIISK